MPVCVGLFDTSDCWFTLKGAGVHGRKAGFHYLKFVKT